MKIKNKCSREIQQFYQLKDQSLSPKIIRLMVIPSFYKQQYVKRLHIFLRKKYQRLYHPNIQEVFENYTGIKYILNCLLKMSAKQPSSIPLYISFCFTNSAFTILPILQDSHDTPNNPKGTFYHPLMQTEMMIVGQMLCLIIFYMQGGRKDSQDDRPRAPHLVCFIPLLMDLVATTLQMVAMNYLSGSVFNIASSIVIVSSAFFTKLLLKKQFNKAQILGCILVIFGVVVTGIGEQLDESASSQQEQVNYIIIKNEFLLGMLLTIIAFIIEGLQMVVAQLIFLNYSITPLEYVGICGSIGTIFWTSALTIMNFTGCPLAEKQCVQDYQGNYHMEHFATFFQDISGNAFQIVITISYIIANTWYNYDVNTIIKTKNAMVYQLISIFSNAVVWIFGIVITLIAGSKTEYHLESLNSKVLLVKFVGFVLSTLGLLLYEKIFEAKEEQQQQLIEQIE